MISASESQLGAFWDYKGWSIIIRSAINNQEHACMKFNRCFMDFLINALGRQAVVITVPVWMMMAESMIDLVKDSLAVAFITQLDDLMASDKTYVINIDDDDDTSDATSMEDPDGALLG